MYMKKKSKDMETMKEFERARKRYRDNQSGRESERNRGRQEFNNYDEIINLLIKRQEVLGNLFSIFLPYDIKIALYLIKHKRYETY